VGLIRVTEREQLVNKITDEDKAKSITFFI